MVRSRRKSLVVREASSGTVRAAGQGPSQPQTGNRTTLELEAGVTFKAGWLNRRPKGFTPLQNSATIWGPSVQTLQHLGDIFKSNEGSGFSSFYNPHSLHTY